MEEGILSICKSVIYEYLLCEYQPTQGMIPTNSLYFKTYNKQVLYLELLQKKTSIEKLHS